MCTIEVIKFLQKHFLNLSLQLQNRKIIEAFISATVFTKIEYIQINGIEMKSFGPLASRLFSLVRTEYE